MRSYFEVPRYCSVLYFFLHAQLPQQLHSAALTVQHDKCLQAKPVFNAFYLYICSFVSFYFFLLLLLLFSLILHYVSDHINEVNHLIPSTSCFSLKP